MPDSPDALELLLQTHGLSFNEPPTLEKWQSVLRVLRPTLKQSERQWQETVLSLEWPMFLVSPAGQIRSWNSGCQEMFGHDQSVIGQDCQLLLTSPLEAMRLKSLVRRALTGERLKDVEFHYCQADGSHQMMMCSLARLEEAEGEETDVLITCTPVKQAGDLQAAPVGQAFYESLLEALPAPVAIFDTDHRYVFCNSAAIKSPELREWIIGKDDAEYIAHRGLDPAIAERRLAYQHKAVAEKKTITFEEDFSSPEGETIHQLRTLTPVFASDGSLLMLMGHGMEITALRQVQKALTELNNELEDRVQARTAQLERMTQQIQHDAFHDTLTGLPNRALFTDRLEQVLVRAAQPKGTQYAVLFLDTDRFKGINDALGHQSGDAMLCEMASRLQAVVHPSGTVARLGGDEFAVLLEPLFHPRQAVHAAERIQRELQRPIVLGDAEINMTVSIGIVQGDNAYQSAADILQDAEIAMYRAKEGGRAKAQVFEPRMREQSVRRNLLQQELRAALAREELRVYLQPIVQLQNGRVTGFEALLRWQHPKRGLLPPGEFIGVAEESGLLPSLDRWMLQESCRQVLTLQQRFPQPSPLTLSVNFSPEHFALPRVYEQVRDTLLETGFDPQHLHIEITETALLSQQQSVRDTLRALQKSGVQLHLDDFGTGYSALSYLHSYPLDTLKIDRSFIHGMLLNEDSAELVRTIVSMAKNMKLSVVAEGIETVEQCEALNALGCEYGQGYYFAQPLDPEQAATYLAQRLSASDTGPA